MYASGSKTKNVVAKSATAAKIPPSRQVRLPRATASAGLPNTNTNVNNVADGVNAARSKFTERRATQPLTPLRTRSLRIEPNSNATQSNKTTPTTPNNATTPLPSDRKKLISNLPLSQSQARTKIWGRKESLKNVEVPKIVEKVEPVSQSEIAIQTNEPEILNRDLLIGDIKFLLPSKALVTEIDHNRQEARKRMLMKAQRKFEEHSEKQEEHLTDLKEFLEKAVISKKDRKPKAPPIELDRKLINSMDEILCRQIPRAESITDIKGRIKKREEDLMNLFDTVENIQINGNKE